MDASQPPPQPPYAPYQPPIPPYAPRRSSPWLWVLAGCGCLFFGVAIMAAIMFPVFAQAREKARQYSCLSNLKQLSLGMMMYSEDYNETLPPSAGWMDTI